MKGVMTIIIIIIIVVVGFLMLRNTPVNDADIITETEIERAPVAPEDSEEDFELIAE